MIQIDMEIPKTCDDCPFHIYHSGKNYVCVATPLFYPMNLANYKDGRKDFCPLKEVSQEPILNKIRAEIETKYGQCKLTEYIVQYDGICTSVNDIGDIADILQIIDKYRAEQEET